MFGKGNRKITIKIALTGGLDLGLKGRFVRLGSEAVLRWSELMGSDWAKSNLWGLG